MFQLLPVTLFSALCNTPGMDTHSRIRSASLIVVAVAFAVMAFASLLIAREVQDLGDKAERDQACAVHWILYDLVIEALDAADSSGFNDPEEVLEEGSAEGSRGHAASDAGGCGQ